MIFSTAEVSFLSPALLKVDCVSSTSARRLSAQRVSTSACKTAADKCCSDELISCDHSFDGSKLQRAELQDEPKDEIISRKACVVANQKTWKDWLKDPAFYKVQFQRFFRRKNERDARKENWEGVFPLDCGLPEGHVNRTNAYM